MGLSVALVAVLLSAAATAEAGPCAEEACAAAICSSAYANSAAEFPYTIDYTTTGDAESTTFVFKGETCGVFSVSVLNGGVPSTDDVPTVPPQQLRLRDICQQNVTLVDKHGQPLYDLASQAPACLVEAAFQVDSLVNNTQLCSDYWQQSRRQYAATSPNAAYRVGLKAVLRSIAVALGDIPEPQVQSISTLCVSTEGSTDKLLRSTAVVSVPADIVDLYLEYLGDEVAGGSFREAVGEFGGPAAWLPTPMRYTTEEYEAVCLVGDANAACAPTTWDPSTAEPLLYTEASAGSGWK
ncbi:hypothetical protein N2152v2_007306 [Parachlorella kessleri]